MSDVYLEMAKNSHKPRTNEAAHVSAPVTATIPAPIDAGSLARIGDMSKDELRALLQTICNARWGEVALMTKQERAEAGRLKLWHGGLTEAEMDKALPLLREALDRDEGKALQKSASVVAVTDARIVLANILQEIDGTSAELQIDWK